MNFTPGKDWGMVRPALLRAVERSWALKIEPFVLRPWRRMMVWVWGFEGGMMMGSGCFIEVFDMAKLGGFCRYLAGE